ncbi:MAG: ABC transporter ATP-binding protein, partial [Firmicutes bacterium]|nr:ABC transporter ATP-binding protein [Bacillota bacterium]
MKTYFKNKFALSDMGAKEMIIAILAAVLQNLALMFPVGLLYVFTGDYLGGVNLGSRTWLYVCGIALCLLLIVLTSIWQYNTSYKATYKESSTRRISLAEKLRKLPLSFFAKRDLADLTGTIMADAEALEHAGSHMIPQFYGSIVSTVLISIGLLFFQWKMAIAAIWPIPIALVIVLTSKRVHAYFYRRQRDA